MVLVEEPPGQGGPSNPKLFTKYCISTTSLHYFVLGLPSSSSLIGIASRPSPSAFSSAGRLGERLRDGFRGVVFCKSASTSTAACFGHALGGTFDHVGWEI